MSEQISRWENTESFQAYATIEYCYWRLGEISKEMNAPVAPINKMIDAATGFTKVKDKERCEEIISLCESVIECKKEIRADYSADEQMLMKIRGFLERL